MILLTLLRKTYARNFSSGRVYLMNSNMSMYLVLT
jgi:hypothetical protein